MPEGLKYNILTKINELAVLANSEAPFQIRLQQLTVQLSEILQTPASLLYLASADAFITPKLFIAGNDESLVQSLRSVQGEKLNEQFLASLLHANNTEAEIVKTVCSPSQQEQFGALTFFVLPLFEGDQKLGALVLATTADTILHEVVLDNLSIIAKQVALLVLLMKASQPKPNKMLQLHENNKDLFAEEFLATLSHELRSPLQTIIGWVSLLQSQTVDKELIHHGLQTIERSARTQNQIINELLDASYSFSQQTVINKQPVLIQALLRQVINTVQPNATQEQQTLSVNIESGTDYIFADAERLTQAFWHIINNAIKFTPIKGHININAKRIKNTYQIILRDSGVGIAPTFLPFVYEPFRQEESTTTRRFRGLGLGLSIARHQIEAHGGNIEIKSSGKNQGTTVWIHLPVQVAPLINGEVEKKSVASPNVEAPQLARDLSGVRVLVVDDDADSLETLREILQRCNSEVQTAGSAQNALRLIQSWTPDILISDVQMPEIDGYELMRRIRRDLCEPHQRLNAIALTSDSRAGERIRALASGFQTHVSKPVNPTELMAVVNSLIEQPKQLQL